MAQVLLLSNSVQRSKVAFMVRNHVFRILPGMLLVTVQLASCSRLRVDRQKILISTPATKGFLAIEQQERLDAALVDVLSARGFTATSRPVSPVDKTSPCADAECLMKQGAKTQSGHLVTWSVTREQIVWAKTTSASLPTETPFGNKHASETVLTQAGELKPRTVSSANWSFLLSLYDVSVDKRLGEESTDCKACTDEEAERALVEAMSHLLALLPGGR